MADSSYPVDFLFRGSDNTPEEDIEITYLYRLISTYYRMAALVGEKQILPDLSSPDLNLLLRPAEEKKHTHTAAHFYEINIPLTAGDIDTMGQIKQTCKDMCKEYKLSKKPHPKPHPKPDPKPDPKPTPKGAKGAKGKRGAEL